MNINDISIDDTYNTSTDVLTLDNISSYLQNATNPNIVLSGDSRFSIKNNQVIYN
jgi:hypothetical protein